MLEYLENLLLGEDSTKDLMQCHGAFSFFLEPVIKGTLPLHSCSIVVTCYETRDRQKPIDFDIKWCKIIGDNVYEVKDYHEHYYHVNPADIDLRLRVIISSKNPKFPGTAYLTIGPIELDGAIKPELEGMLINRASFFKIFVVSIDDVKVPPNLSLFRIEKPYLYLTFDQHIISRASDPNKYAPMVFNFESDNDVRIKVDSENINNILVVFKDLAGKESILKAKFDSRMQRDIFYIYLKLMRILKAEIIHKEISKYEEVLKLSWNLLNVSLMDGDRGRTYLTIERSFIFDLIRENLKSMVRMNKELNEENTTLLDSVDLLEADLDASVKEFRNLLEDGKTKNTKNLRAYEQKSKSIIRESSVIIDGVKQKDKRKKKELEQSNIVEMQNVQDDLDSLKKVNEVLKKEIEVYKASPTNKSAIAKTDNVYLSALVGLIANI